MSNLKYRLNFPSIQVELSFETNHKRDIQLKETNVHDIIYHPLKYFNLLNILKPHYILMLVERQNEKRKTETILINPTIIKIVPKLLA